MILLGLLAIPILIGLGAMILGKGKFTWKEFLVQEVVLLVVIGGGYGASVLAARWGAASDVEIWNGKVARKDKGTHGCCHDYPCNPHPCNCDTNGDCDTCWDTCYEHSHDVYWDAKSTNGETVYSNRCNAPGTSTPRRWAQIQIGEPTAVEHSYQNYIKANPDTVLRRQGAAEKFRGLLPAYPRVYDHYRIRQFLFVKIKVDPSALKFMNEVLMEMNGDLGARKQLNIIFVVARTDDPSYAEALREHWIGGKKNDLVVVMGAKEYPKLDFVEVVTWSRSEEMKLAIRDRIMETEEFGHEKVFSIVREEAGKKFVRQEMAEYEYLMSSVEPPTWAIVLNFVVGLIASVGLAIYFWLKDPFGDRRRYGYGFHRSRDWNY